MNTVDRLNRIVDYVEAHIDEDLDTDVISKIACLSAYDTQRVFAFIAEMSLSEYIRKRRLTLAGYELKNSDAKVIDVALKYGYDSPISFARAFQAFHGITPSMAKKSNKPLRQLSRFVFQITVKEVMNMIKSKKMVINEKTYNASYYGEADMSSWSDVYYKRQYWRLENAYDDFKDCFKVGQVLPYNNYPPMDIKIGQVFVIDYFVKNSEEVERKYYISDGFIWEDMESTEEIAITLDPLKLESLSANGKDYVAEYYGHQHIGHWSEKYAKRVFWRLQNAYDDFKNKPRTGDVLPYTNYNPMNIKIGQVFVIDYHLKGSDEVKRTYYISDGTVWNNMESTAEVIID